MSKQDRRLGFHEDYGRAEPVKGPSDKSFGRTFFVVFSVLAGVFAWKADLALGAGFATAALVFLALAYLAPTLLRPLNRAWLAFGFVLHRIVNPIVMGLLFFVVITPVGLAMRLSGKDPLSLRWDAEAASYWIKRDPPGPTPETMTLQF